MNKFLIYLVFSFGLVSHFIYSDDKPWKWGNEDASENLREKERGELQKMLTTLPETHVLRKHLNELSSSSDRNLDGLGHQLYQFLYLKKTLVELAPIKIENKINKLVVPAIRQSPEKAKELLRRDDIQKELKINQLQQRQKEQIPFEKIIENICLLKEYSIGETDEQIIQGQNWLLEQDIDALSNPKMQRQRIEQKKTTSRPIFLRLAAYLTSFFIESPEEYMKKKAALRSARPLYPPAS